MKMDLSISGIWFIDLLLYGAGLALVSWLAYEAHWHMKYRKEYSEVMTDKGIVTDMDYTPSRTTYNAATKTTSTTPEQNEIYIEFEKIGKQDFDNEDLYQRVRIDDDVTAEYVEVWRVEKENPRNRELMYHRVLEITNPKGRIIELE
jgi:hypothetical protein